MKSKMDVEAVEAIKRSSNSRLLQGINSHLKESKQYIPIVCTHHARERRHGAFVATESPTTASLAALARVQ